MTAVDYQPFIERMIQLYEGAYGFNPSDPGGPTKFGVTCYDLAEHRHQTMSSMQAWAPLVRAMTLDEAEAIYAAKYATACCFNELQAGADCTVLDFGVNSGPSRAIKYAQMVVGVTADGIMGPITLGAINAYGASNFINELCDARLGFLERLNTWSVFGRGWSARVADLRAYSIGLTKRKAKPTVEGYVEKPMLIPLAYGKAY